MSNIYIKAQHMKHRCYFISVMCFLSIYTWFSNNLFTYDFYQIKTVSASYINCVIFMFYLHWDLYMMLYSKHKSILFRKDLFIHHIISLLVYLSYINSIEVIMSNILIMECISLLNYTLKDNSKLLNLYRTLCILCIRMPISLWFWIYYNPTYVYPYYYANYSKVIYYYLTILNNIFLFFIVYDLYILKQIIHYKVK